MRKASDSQAGYSLIELMIVVGIMGVVTGMAVLQIGSVKPGLAGDSAMRVVLSQVNQAREAAITQRRNMRLSFIGTNMVRIVREEVPGPTLTTVSTVGFEGGLQFLRVVTGANIDTPDGFGIPTTNAVAFGTATEIKFSPEGVLIDQDGVQLNGTVFVALANQPLPTQKGSARAVTIFGSTGRVRGYRWDGSNWKVV